MGVLSRLIGRVHRATAPERRYSGTFGDFGAGPAIASGIGLAGGRMAENLSTVTACVELISGSLATLPVFVFRRIPKGREEAPDHPVAALIRRPCPRLSWTDWLSMTASQCLLYGNALSIIKRDGDGNPTELIPIPWQNVNVQLLPNGRLAFDVMVMVLPWGGTGSPQRFLEDEVFLLRCRSDDGYLGRSPLARAPAVLAAAIGAQNFSLATWQNGISPSGALKHPGKLNPEARSYLAESIQEAHSGAARARRLLVLDEGMSYDPMLPTAESSELVASRQFSGDEIARLFNVPPPLIGELRYGSFTNVETAGRFFTTFCLSVWAKRIESEFQRSVFTDDDPDHHLMIDLAGLQRGDDAARWASYGIAIDKGILQVNEVRELEGWNPIPTPAEPVPGAET